MQHIVQKTADGKLTELFPLTNGLPTQIIAGDPPAQWPWLITESMPDAELNKLGIYRVANAEPPFGQVIIKYHFEMQGGKVVQVIDQTADEPARLPDPLTVAQYANQRIDAGIAAGMEAVDQVDVARSRTRAPRAGAVTQDQIDALQAQIDILQEALKATLQAQVGRQPRQVAK